MAKPLFRNLDQVKHLFTEQTPTVELIDLLDEVEKVYEHLQQISSVSHKAENFSVAIFGSARLPKSSPEFEFVSKLTQLLVEQISVDIVTGGGPGIMEAASQGAMNAVRDHRYNVKVGKKPTIYGMSVRLPHEEKSSPYIHINKFHEHFTTRLQSFVSLIQGAYIDAGGIGTLLEMSLLWQLKQVNHLPVEFPLVVSPVWKPMLETFYDMTFSQRKNSIQLINSDNMELIKFSDDIEEIVEIFCLAHQKWQDN
jgi:predicted Rossmann-fold nucleotide-binding protein